MAENPKCGVAWVLLLIPLVAALVALIVLLIIAVVHGGMGDLAMPWLGDPVASL